MLRRWVMGLGIGLCGLSIANQVSETKKDFVFSRLLEGQRIEVGYRSSGCFRSVNKQFVFESGKVQVYDVEFDPQSRMEKRVDVGSVTLDRNDVIALDGLLRFYRTNPEGYCTTTDTIYIEFKQGERTLATEAFKDATCTPSSSEMLKLADLAQRVQNKQIQ